MLEHPFNAVRTHDVHLHNVFVSAAAPCGRDLAAQPFFAHASNCCLMHGHQSHQYFTTIIKPPSCWYYFAIMVYLAMVLLLLSNLINIILREQQDVTQTRAMAIFVGGKDSLILDQDPCIFSFRIFWMKVVRSL